MVSALLMVLLTGCSTEPVCVMLRPFERFGNHVQTYEVAIDVEGRRVYTTALGSQVALAYDADSYEVLQDFPLGSDPLTTPDIEVDLDGNLWLVANNDPPLVHFDRSDGTRTIVWDELSGARDLAARASGGMVVLGRSDSSNNTIIAFDADLEPVARLELEPATRGLVPMDDHQRVGIAYDGGDLLVLSTEDLSELARCRTTIERPWHGAQLDDGTVILANESSIGTACGGEPQAWRVGRENMEVVSLGGHAVVLDRIGEEDGWDPNLGIARLVDADGVYDQYATGKNTGFGAFDPDTDRLWVNSEGSSEVQILDPDNGALEHAVQVGTFLDGLAVDPEDPSVLFASGRLSDTLVRIQDGAVTASTDAVHWPYAPIPDLERDLLWVLSHTEGTLHALDRSTLELVRSIDPGLGSNTLLTFGNIFMHPTRGSLLFAESQQDLLLELDPDSGAELGRWDLGGPLIDDPDEVGELAIRVDTHTGRVYTARSNDVRVQLVDLDDEPVETVFLPDDVAEALSAGHATDFMRLYPKEGLIFVGGKAVALDTLDRLEDQDLPVTRIAGPHPSKKHQWIAVDDRKRHIVRIDSDGEELGRQAFARHELYATVFKVSGGERTVTMTRALHGNVCSFPVRALK